MSEGRRSTRVLAQFPIQVFGADLICQGVTAVVNRQGALIVVPGSYGIESEVRVQNVRTREFVQCRVIWDGGRAPDGQFKLGIELSEDKPDFWGVDYNAAASAAKHL